ncbi:MAG: HAMP domain-containing sensor histidine kinase [Desulfocapsaceae bacterium]|nr:HAMP domain-containing sensor histidine kinase [Desulfocapsaceae bacterium]
MFSVQRRYLSKPLRKYFLLSCIVFVLLLIFPAGVLIVVKETLEDHCRDDVAVRLEQYIQNRLSGEFFFERDRQVAGNLHGLDFIRVILDNEEFFLSRGAAADVDFQGIVNLDPGSSTAWVALDDKATHSHWAIHSQALAANITVQGGKAYPQIVALYDKIQSGLLLLVLPALLLAVLISLYCRRQSLLSIREVECALEERVAQQTNHLLQVEDNSELNRLYQLLNKLISQNRQLVEEMRNSLDNVAHDLRTPMTRLRSVAEYGLRENTPEQLGEALSDCLEESEKLLSMLTIMMSVAEAESGTMRLALEDVELKGMISEVINLYEYVAEDKKIALQMDVPEDIVVHVDRTRMRQVWANLLDNGIKYGKRGGFVKIYANISNGVISVVFEDNGMGISAGEQQRIWERLFRGDRSRSQQGLGLGLNYVRAVIEAHGGHVQVKSRLHEGARFEVQLPK